MNKDGNIFYSNARRFACASLFLVLEKVFKLASVSRVVVNDRRFSLVFVMGSSAMINSRRSIVNLFLFTFVYFLKNKYTYIHY